MAKYDGKDMVFKFDTFSIPSGALVSVDFPEVRDELEATGAGQDAKEFLPSETSATITVNAWDDVGGTIFDAFPVAGSTEEAVEFYPQGNTSGKPKMAANAFVTNRQRPVTHNQVVPITITLRVNGAVTHSDVT